MSDHETSIRTYLLALSDPASLRDDAAIADAEKALEGEEDPIERLRLQQDLIKLREPSLESAEEQFVTHAKAWADSVGIGGKALAAEGVPASVLRRAGFAVSGGRGRGRSSKRASSGGGGKRVTTEEVIDAMPKGAFTVKMLQEISGASPGVVRKAISQEVEGGRLTEDGTDPDHSGPGRAPTLYRR